MSDRIDDCTTLFRRSWSLYDAITAGNYMFHREFYGEIAAIVSDRGQAGDYTLLDLGCGNARFLSPCLRAAPPLSYTGVDLSPTALAEAHDYLAGLDGVSLHEDDMVEFARRAGEGSFDIVFSGYAMHHLDEADKARLLSACSAALAPGGSFLLIDVLREDGQSREDYLTAYLGMMRGEWTAVPAEMIEEACNHVAAHDQPSSLAELSALAEEAGLGRITLLANYRQHHLIRFER
ncbi:MAG: class I SAM-dependent methyltransferase [Verrucomicrobiales bacterium]|nr:class I SAM-dependent methyltransferase [Verrucomicrobiales bacterium]